jgi:quinol---cytochrome-c reductase cytochrome c subunit
MRRRLAVCAGVAALIAPSLLAQHPSADPLARGEQIFHQRCAVCHGDEGQGVSARISIAGPNIQAEHNHGDVLAAIETGPSHMPAFARVLSVDDMKAVADYVTQKIAVMPLKEGDLSGGGELYREYCATCHRTAVRGGALAFVGTNAPALTDKSAALVAGAIRWGPGPMPKFDKSVLSDDQVDAIVTYVKYVQHPASPGGSTLHWYGPVAEGFAAFAVVLFLGGITMWIEKGQKG